VQIDLIVLHAISLPSGVFEAQRVADFFAGKLDCSLHPALADLQDVRVSAHFLVDRQGRVMQFVPIQRRAWHAGLSVWQGRENCNDFSIGIELLGDEQHAFTAAQYREAARLCKALMHACPAIHRSRIVGHSDIAVGRKWDPGCQWSWAHFHRSLAHIRRLHRGVR